MSHRHTRTDASLKKRGRLCDHDRIKFVFAIIKVQKLDKMDVGLAS